MLPPFPLYVDEISPDKIKATVFNGNNIFQNLKMMSLDMPSPSGDYLFGISDGIFIMPVGRFICMLIRDHFKSSMIILDLVGKDELAERMAEKLDHVDLQEKFMDTYAQIMRHPENHKRFRLVVGNRISDL